MGDYDFDGGLFRGLRSRFLTPKKIDDQEDQSGPFTADHRQRRSTYDERWEYYRGRQRPPLKVRAGQKDTNIIENYTKQIVNDTVYFLFGAGDLSFEIGAIERDLIPAEEEILRDFWRPILWNPASFLEKMGQSGAISGTPFVRLYTTGDRIQFVTLDTGLVDVITADENIDDVLEYHSYWFASSEKTWKRHRVIKSDSGVSWEVVEESQSGGDWTVDESVAWAYEFPPIFHCQNLPLAHDFWGMSDIEDAALNDSINEISTDTRKILHYYASPTTLAYGITANQLNANRLSTESGSIIPIANEQARLENLEMQSNLQSSADKRSSLIDTYYAVTDSVRLDPKFTNFGALSGFAIQLLYMPLIMKTKKKQKTYGMMLSQMNNAILALNGVADPAYIRPLWPSVLPDNKLEMAQVAAQLASFVNIEGALQQAGYSPDDIQSMVNELGAVDYEVVQ